VIFYDHLQLELALLEQERCCSTVVLQKHLIGDKELEIERKLNNALIVIDLSWRKSITILYERKIYLSIVLILMARTYSIVNV